ncbi:hypothetical protein V4B17_05005 [Bartonella sp. B23]
MAGTLIQMLAAQLSNAQAMPSVGTSDYPDALLQQRIRHLLSLLEDGNLSKVLETLNIFVQPVEAAQKRVQMTISNDQKISQLSICKGRLITFRYKCEEQDCKI